MFVSNLVESNRFLGGDPPVSCPKVYFQTSLSDLDRLFACNRESDWSGTNVCT
jgi:hypothetical protein